MKLDYSKFKKVSDDEKCTVLKHPRGHEIRIAKDALTPEHKEELSKLKGYKDEVEEQPKGNKMAEGGDTTAYNRNLPCLNPSCHSKGAPHPNCRCYMAEGGEARTGCRCCFKEGNMMAKGGEPQMLADGTPEGVNPTTQDQPNLAQILGKAVDYLGQATSGVQHKEQPPPQQTPQPPAAQQLVQPQGDQGIMSAAGMQGQPAPDQSAAPAAPPGDTGTPSPSIPNANTTLPGANAPTNTYVPSNPDDRNAWVAQHQKESQDSMNDALNGHIHPMTYGQLASQGSLGKLGSIFGLLVGGIGSGISGQPNALLSMWDKTIDRDIHAQMASNANAQNFYRLAEQHGINSATMQQQQQQNKQMGAQTAATQSQTKLSNFLNATNKAQVSALATQVNQFKQMPEMTPQQISAKQRAAQGINLLMNHINTQMMQADTLRGAVDAQIYYQQHGPQILNEGAGKSATEQPQASNPIQPILKPNADQLLAAAKDDPRAKGGEYEQLVKVVEEASKADAARAAIKPTYDTMKAASKDLEPASAYENKGLPFNIGEIAPSVANIKNRFMHPNANSKYEAAKTNLATELGNAIPNLGVGGFRDAIEANSPTKLNNEETTNKLMNNVADMAARPYVNHPLLKKYNMLYQAPKKKE